MSICVYEWAAHIYTYTHTHIYTYTHIHIYTYKHIHIYIHISHSLHLLTHTQGWDFRDGGVICTQNHKAEQIRLNGKGRKWLDLFVINHYSRSLEKYGLKSKTWKTSTGEVRTLYSI
jgi:hypothetical protein